jgi:hypothetical protein
LCGRAKRWKQCANTLPSAFEQLFAEHRLPIAIRSDNGVPTGQLETG